MAVILRSSALITGTGLPGSGFTSLWWNPGTVGGSTADATDVLARFRTLWETMKSHISTSITIDYDPICIAVDAPTGVLTGAFAGTDPTSTVGTFAGDALPRQTQGLGRWATSTVVGGRRVRGRIFIPGPCETDNDAAGLPVAGYITALTASLATVLVAGATASAPVIWHRPTGGAGGSSPLITGVGAAPTWSVLRSRRS
jgi:hypothetical protein